MAPSSIELKVKSCKDLKAFNFFQKLSVYAVVSIISEDSEKKHKTIHTHQKTPIDREGDGNPDWNHEIRFDLKDVSLSSLDLHQYNLFLEFQLLCEVIIFGDKTIGKVRVPIRDLVEESRGGIRFMSYQVRSTDGNPNGVLNFSYKVIDDEKKIGGSIVYPAIESTGFQVVYPPPSNSYPRPESDNPSTEVCYPRPECLNSKPELLYPPPGIHYPTPEICYPPLDQIHYPSWEVHHMAQPPPPPEVVYPPPCPVVYPLVPDPCGFGAGGRNYPICAYPTNNGELQASQQRGPIAGYWDVR